MSTRWSRWIALTLLLASPAIAAPPPPATTAPPATGPGGMPAMQKYWFGFLMRGPGWTPQRSAHTDSVQMAHLENIGRMFEAGALVCAGPFLDGAAMRGIFIFRGDSATAVSLTAHDQAIQEKRLTLELRPWVGPVGISDAYRAARSGNPDQRDSLVRYQMALLKKGAAGAPAASDSLLAFQRAHLQHLVALMRDGTLAVAGPFADGRDPEGILIFRADSAHAARAMAEDPLVRRGWLTVELHPWMTADGILPAPVAAPGK